MKIIKKKKRYGRHAFYAIVHSQEWFKKHNTSRLLFLRDAFVVGSYFDFHDGVTSHIEGMTTISVCENIKHAKMIFNSLKSDR